MGPSVLHIGPEAVQGAHRVLHHPSEKEIDLQIETLLAGNESLTVHLQGDAAHLWTVFRSRFRWIEACGGIVTGPDGRLLMIHRLGSWDMPKGKLEKGETSEACALREVEEECGIGHLRITGEPWATYHTYPYKGTHALKQTLWYPMRTDVLQEPVAQQEEDISQARWCTREEVLLRLPQAYPAIRILLQQAMGISG